MEQNVRRNKAVASYCFGGLLSLFLLVQIITGGFRLIENPLKVPTLSHLSLIGEGPLECNRSLRPNHGNAIVADGCENVDAKPLVEGACNLWSEPNPQFHQCIQRTNDHKRTNDATNGYLVTFANGGLNQMRTAICDMVAVARAMNATLVIPDLDHRSYWDDPSDFEDIFDVEHFVKELEDDIHIVKALPRDIKFSKIPSLQPKSWSELSYYTEELMPVLLRNKAIRFSLTDSRLANNRIPDDIQRLRCRANYEALQFQRELRALGEEIVKRLKSRGSYIALHLRFEKDMLAFSGCTAGLSKAEANELRSIRYNNSRWKEKEIDSESRRASGGCPLTPLEIGFLLKAMSYPQNTTVYIAGGEIYGGKKRLESFTRLYPNVVTKETITSAEELEPYRRYQNRLAALDYMVAVESDLFIPTFDGNMARAVQGHRRFLGHRKTLIPNRSRIVSVFDEYQSQLIDWETVEFEVRQSHSNRQGHPHYRVAGSSHKLEENFYANPLPGCICESQKQTTKVC